ncbi:MAG: PTS galactosamine transporter subunit IIC [Erysipelotrichaceae bacterium]
MEINLIQGLLLCFLAFIAGLDYLMEALFIFRPIIIATLTGLVLGDLETGIIAGGLTELAFAGLTPAGGAEPPDPISAGIMCSVIAITTNVTPTVALGLALPFSFLMQNINVFVYSAFAIFMGKLDNLAKEGKARAIKNLNISTLALSAVVYAVIIFLCTYVAQEPMAALVEMFPERLLNGLNVAGGILPAIGFGMLLVILLKKEFFGFLILGFVLASFIPFGNILPVALIGGAIALIDYYRKDDKTEGGSKNVGI